MSIPAAITVNPASVFQFDALGRYRDAAGAPTLAPLVITVTGDGALPFTVEHETGFVHS